MGAVYQRIRKVGYHVRLSLGGEGVAFQRIIAYGIAGKVAVQGRVGVGGLHYQHFFAVSVRYVRQHRAQVIQAAVPEGVPAGGEHVVIQGVYFQLFSKVFELFRIFRIGEMQRGERIRVYLPDGIQPRVHKGYDAGPAGLAAHPPVGLVARLHHAHIHAVFLKRGKGRQGELIHRLCLFFCAHACPGFGRHLLSGIRPEVRVMKVHYQFKARFCAPEADLNKGIQIADASAVGPSFRVVGIVPQAGADVGYAVLLKQREYIRLVPVKVIKARAAVFQRDDGRQIHAEYKIIGHAPDVPDIKLRVLA